MVSSFQESSYRFGWNEHDIRGQHNKGKEVNIQTDSDAQMQHKSIGVWLFYGFIFSGIVL